MGCGGCGSGGVWRDGWYVAWDVVGWGVVWCGGVWCGVVWCATEGGDVSEESHEHAHTLYTHNNRGTQLYKY